MHGQTWAAHVVDGPRPLPHRGAATLGLCQLFLGVRARAGRGDFRADEKTHRRLGAGVSTHAGGSGRTESFGYPLIMLRRYREIRMQIHQLMDACLFSVAFWLAYELRTSVEVADFLGRAPESSSFDSYVWL